MYLHELLNASPVHINHDNGYPIYTHGNTAISVLLENCAWKHPLWPPLNERYPCLLLTKYIHSITENDAEVFETEDVIITVPPSCRSSIV